MATAVALHVKSDAQLLTASKMIDMQALVLELLASHPFLWFLRLSNPFTVREA